MKKGKERRQENARPRIRREAMKKRIKNKERERQGG